MDGASVNSRRAARRTLLLVGDVCTGRLAQRTRRLVMVLDLAVRIMVFGNIAKWNVEMGNGEAKTAKFRVWAL